MKTALITGASRGIGREIALKLAEQGYNIIVAAKSDTEHPKLSGTIFSVAEEIEALNVQALPIKVDIRNEEDIVELVKKIKDQFGGIDILVNNASAINLSSSEALSMKHYDLMHDINVRGTFMVSKYCIPLLKESSNAHILTLAPPLNLTPYWMGKHLGYSMSKFGMSMTVVGLANELGKYGIGVNALWPKTTIATAAVQNILGGDDMVLKSRKPSIMADAAMAIFKRDAKSCTGNFFIDEEVLIEEGISNFNQYAIDPNQKLMIDLFLDN